MSKSNSINKPLNVGQYFTLTLPRRAAVMMDWSSGDFSGFPIDSVCGMECKEAIDAAASFIKHAERAGVADIDYATIGATVAETVCIYCFG